MRRIRRGKDDWWIDPEWEVDPDDKWHAECALPTGASQFIEYGEKDAADPLPKPKKADRLRFGFQSPDNAYED